MNISKDKHYFVASYTYTIEGTEGEMTEVLPDHFDTCEEAVNHLIDIREEMKMKPLTWDEHVMTSYKVCEIKELVERHI